MTLRVAAAARVRRLIARATGPDAITWWTWIVTAPFALTVMSGLQYISGGPWAVAAVAALQHAALGGLLLCGHALLRTVPQRGRTAVVFVVFAGVGALRPLLSLAAGATLGIAVQPGDLPGRVMINVIVTVTMFSLIAVAADLVHDHLGVYRRLRSARSSSARDAARAAERIRSLRRAAVDDVLLRLDDATTTAATDGIEPAEAARLLRALADEVVRPASHRLYQGIELPADAAAPTARVSGGDWIASVVGGLRAAPPLVLSLLFAALAAPFGIQQYGVIACLPPLLCGIAVVWAGNVVIARVVAVARPGLRLVVLLAGYGAVGALLSVTSAIVVTWIGGEPRLVWFEAGTYWVIGLGVALVASLSVRVRQDQGELEAALQANVLAAARMRGEYDHQRATLARSLHSGVQSELIAAALVLGSDSADDAAAALRAVVARVRAELLTPHAEPEASERVAALVESWRSAIPLRTAIGDGVWDRLREPSRASAVVDAISEGLANAVRHGDGTPISLEVRPDRPSGVAVIVTSGGTLVSTRPGIGLRQLSERGAVALRESGSGRVELAVAIP